VDEADRIRTDRAPSGAGAGLRDGLVEIDAVLSLPR
jgi:hypothetical protein